MRLSSLQVTNYRSLESISLRFPTFYTAICGANNAGKTNVVRAIRAVLPEEVPFPRFIVTEDITYKEDCPAWKRKSSATITIVATLEIHPEQDAALHLFIGVTEHPNPATTEHLKCGHFG